MEEEERVDGLCGARSGARSGVGVDVDEERVCLASSIIVGWRVSLRWYSRKDQSLAWVHICMSSYSQPIA
jgi:hypothetical protein